MRLRTELAKLTDQPIALQLGYPNEFSVFKGDRLVFSKRIERRFPTAEEIIKR